MAVTLSYGIHACACPDNTTEAALLLAAAGTEYTGLLRVVNLGSSTNTYRLAHCAAAGAAESAEWLAYDTEIDANSTHDYSIDLGVAEEIRYKSGTADEVTFHYSGTKKVTS